jgi:hypothetical protein
LYVEDGELSLPGSLFVDVARLVDEPLMLPGIAMEFDQLNLWMHVQPGERSGALTYNGATARQAPVIEIDQRARLEERRDKMNFSPPFPSSACTGCRGTNTESFRWPPLKYGMS